MGLGPVRELVADQELILGTQPGGRRHKCPRQLQRKCHYNVKTSEQKGEWLRFPKLGL
jgi:hypothetical protein